MGSVRPRPCPRVLSSVVSMGAKGPPVIGDLFFCLSSFLEWVVSHRGVGGRGGVVVCNSGFCVLFILRFASSMYLEVHTTGKA